MHALGQCVSVLAVGTTLAVIVHAEPSHVATTPERPQTLVDRFLASGAPALVTYHATRTLHGSTRGGRMSASLKARTWVNSDGRFDYEVLDADGSGLIRRHVLLAALEGERRMRDRQDAQADLTPANYEFSVDEDQPGPLLRIGLLPRRRSRYLIVGAVFATPDLGDLVRVEGQLARRPSFWTRRVRVTRRYGRIAGVRVPLEMSSTADVRIVGESTFAMTWEYSSVNGQAVPEARSDDTCGTPLVATVEFLPCAGATWTVRVSCVRTRRGSQLVAEVQRRPEPAGQTRHRRAVVTVKDLETLYDYSYWANAKLFSTIAGLTDEEFVRPIAGSWASVRSTLVHMMSAEGGWLERAGGPKRGPMLKADDFPTLASVSSFWAAQEQKMRAFLGGLTDADLSRRLQFSIPQLSLSREMPVGEMLHHAAIHNSHHRGQVSLLVRALGRAPGDVDILFYYGERGARA